MKTKKLKNTYHVDHGKDEVLFVPDEQWSTGAGAIDVYYYTTEGNDYYFLGKIVRKLDEQILPVFTAFDPYGKQFLPPSRNVKTLIQYYKENGCEVKLLQQQKEIRQQLKNIRQGKYPRPEIER